MMSGATRPPIPLVTTYGTALVLPYGRKNISEVRRHYSGV